MLQVKYNYHLSFLRLTLFLNMKSIVYSEEYLNSQHGHGANGCTLISLKPHTKKPDTNHKTHRILWFLTRSVSFIFAKEYAWHKMTTWLAFLLGIFFSILFVLYFCLKVSSAYFNVSSVNVICRTSPLLTFYILS